ncbi:MAG: outer membrane protein assembly factor BamE [Alphaproteobacteria bacterium]|nr:outer membrane protein assembly factor BamE [Alphaproteobacteria bacterium]
MQYMRCFSFLIFTLLLTSCSHFTRYTGNLLRTEDLEKIRISESSRQDVILVLGPPTIYSSADPDQTVYYAHNVLKVSPDRTARFLSSRVHKLHFDEKGILDNIEEITKIRDVDHATQKTPAVYKKASWWQEILVSSAARFR